MRHFTTIMRLYDTPYAGLELLSAPVTLAPTAGEPATIERAAGAGLTEVEPAVGPAALRAVGHVSGVVIGDDRRIKFFVVTLDEGERVLVPLDAVELGADEVRVRWTPEQLRAQPSFVDEALLPRDRYGAGPPAEARWMPARPSVVPPGPRANRPKAVRGAAAGGVAGAAAGALVGLAAGGPAVALGVALFFAIGGGIAGAIAGGSRESATDASELDTSSAPTLGRDRRIVALEHKLREKSLYDGRLLVANTIRASAEADAIFGRRSEPSLGGDIGATRPRASAGRHAS